MVYIRPTTNKNNINNIININNNNPPDYYLSIIHTQPVQQRDIEPPEYYVQQYDTQPPEYHIVVHNIQSQEGLITNQLFNTNIQVNVPKQQQLKNNCCCFQCNCKQYCNDCCKNCFQCYFGPYADGRLCGLCYHCSKKTNDEKCDICLYSLSEHLKSGFFTTIDSLSSAQDDNCCCTLFCLPVKFPIFLPCFLGSICNSLLNKCCSTKKINYLC